VLYGDGYNLAMIDPGDAIEYLAQPGHHVIGAVATFSDGTPPCKWGPQNVNLMEQGFYVWTITP
jgi:hypothetical protein